MVMCIHHNDLDGWCSAFLVSQVYDTTNIEANYDKKVDIDEIDEDVFIVDFHIPPEDLKELQERVNVYWIDHHGTSIEKYKGIDVPGIQEEGKGACELVYEYLADKLPYKEKPLFVKLISDWDVWKFEYPDTKSFKYGLERLVSSPDEEVWEKLRWEPKVEEIIKEGEIVHSAITKHYRDTLDKYGYETRFEGYTCIACNAGNVNSEMFQEKDHDINIAYTHNGDKYIVSLYSTEVDVSKIAEKYGGGGHPGASGFTCNSLPFEKLD